MTTSTSTVHEVRTTSFVGSRGHYKMCVCSCGETFVHHSGTTADEMTAFYNHGFEAANQEAWAAFEAQQ